MFGRVSTLLAKAPRRSGHAIFEIEVKSSGTYKVEVFGLAPTGKSDSFWIHIGGVKHRCLVKSSPDWRSTVVNTQDEEKNKFELTLNLESGSQSMKLRCREDGFKFSQLTLTKID